MITTQEEVFPVKLTYAQKIIFEFFYLWKFFDFFLPLKIFRFFFTFENFSIFFYLWKFFDFFTSENFSIFKENESYNTVQQFFSEIPYWLPNCF